MKSLTSLFIKTTFVAMTFVLSVNAFAQQKSFPKMDGVHWVYDEAGVLTPNDITQLEYILKAERDSTSNQIAVYIIKSLEGDEMNSYANRVFNDWKLGDEKKDNGVLFLVSVEDRQMKIETGQGLEGVLTDVQSSRINRNQVAPYFRQGDYASGIKAAVVGIIQTVKGEYTNDEPIKKRTKRSSSWVTLVIILIFIIISSRRRGGGSGGYMSRGGFFPMGGGGYGGSSGSWGGGGSFGGGGFSGGGGSSDSW